MSMLGSQADELRLMASLVHEYDYDEIGRTLCEAADIIEGLQDELREVQGIDDEECEWTLKEKWPNRTGDDYVYGYETGCGARHTWWPDSLPNYCPTCGGRVKAVKR